MKNYFRIFDVLHIIATFVSAYLIVNILYKLGLLDIQLPFSIEECSNRYYIHENGSTYFPEIIFSGLFFFLQALNVERNGIGFYFFNSKEFLFQKSNYTFLKKIKIFSRTFLSALFFIIIIGFAFAILNMLVHLIFEGFSYLRKTFNFSEFTLNDYCNLYFYQWLIDLVVLLFAGYLYRDYIKNKFKRQNKYYLLEILCILSFSVGIIFINKSIAINRNNNEFIQIENLQQTYNKALVEYQNRNYLLAIKYADLIIENNSLYDSGDEINIYILRGNCKAYLKDYNNSLWDYKEFIKIKGRNLYVYELISDNYYTLKDYFSSILYLDSAINILPSLKYTDLQFEKKTFIYYYKRANSKYHLKQFESAILDCNRAIDRNNSILEIYRLRALCYREKGDIEKALTDLKYVIQKDSLNSLAYAGIGKCNYVIGNLKEALQYYDKSISIFPYADVYRSRYKCKRDLKFKDWEVDSIIATVLDRKELDVK